MHYRKTRRYKADDDSDDDGPPPDPDDPQPAPAPVKKEPKSTGEAREVHVSVKKVEEKGGQLFQGGLTAARREMLQALREEEDEPWISYEYCDGEVCFHFIHQYYPLLIDICWA